ncbi:zinc finger protein 436 [Acyrthosiphon pisum]|uniref:C2H2-type domain-containing protein n=1 Tax=Acyrthosiphon pisum TaxID=7029 RepID=A0A8R2JNC2_ACYPI|nr:zinc finger protein 436 [Acyrthosiphon pisum]|eukprot:XP_008189480.1 PREDICTED: zinc finger protein 436 isoform X2 [Acyrthosiphon pisum]
MIKIKKKDLNDGNVFEGTVKNECHSSELIAQINSDKTSNVHNFAEPQRVECEFAEKIKLTQAMIKIEKKDLNDGNVFEGTVKNEYCSSELIAQINSDKTSSVHNFAEPQRVECEFAEKLKLTQTEIKIEKKDLNDGNVFEGTVKNKCHSSELIAQINSDKTSNVHNFAEPQRVECEFAEKIKLTQTMIKIEKKDLNDGNVFEGTVKNECHSSELIAQINSDKTSNVHNFAEPQRVECEFAEKLKLTQTEIKIEEKDLNDGNVFEGTVKNKCHSSELIAQINSDKTSNVHNFAEPQRSRNQKIHTIKIKKLLVCDSCKMSYYSKSDLITHILRCAEAKPCTSHISDKGVSQASDLEKNKKILTGLKSYKCDISDKKCSRASNLTMHLRTHTGDKPFKCDNCGKKFSAQSFLIIHSRTHTGDKPFKCDICDKGFSLAGNLKRHKSTHTGDKPFKCDICDKRFSQSSSLKTHMRTHTGDKPFKCDNCDSRFSVQSTLIKHLRTHTGDKPFKCDNCDSRFSLQSTLIKHLRTHTGDKPYKCDNCEKRFSVQSNLIRHSRTHTGDKRFKCDNCEKMFSVQSNLMRHSRTHTGDKRFKCDNCEKRFYTQSNLKTHKSTHTGDKPFKCDICDKKFSRAGNLKRHKSTHTSVKSYN